MIGTFVFCVKRVLANFCGHSPPCAFGTRERDGKGPLVAPASCGQSRGHLAGAPSLTLKPAMVTNRRPNPEHRVSSRRGSTTSWPLGARTVPGCSTWTFAIPHPCPDALVEVDERVTAERVMLTRPKPADVKRQLTAARRRGQRHYANSLCTATTCDLGAYGALPP